MGGGGAIYDAVMAAARKLSHRAKSRRRVILLISEGKDRGSTIKMDELMQVLERDDVIVYTLSFSPYLTPFTQKPEDVPAQTSTIDFIKVFSELGRLGKRDPAGNLASVTGGEHLGFIKQTQLERTVQRIGEDLHRQYVLSFVPPCRCCGIHTIEVRVPGRLGARVRTRPGDWLSARN